MITLKKRQETSLAVFLALGLSFLLWIVAENSALFTADVAGPVVEFDESTDIVTYVKDGAIYLVAGKPVQSIQSMSVLVSYDNDTVGLNRSHIRSNNQLTFAAGDPGYATIIFERLGSIQKGQELARILVTGEPHDVAISDIVVTFEDGKKEMLAVSSL